MTGEAPDWLPRSLQGSVPAEEPWWALAGLVAERVSGCAGVELRHFWVEEETGPWPLRIRGVVQVEVVGRGRCRGWWLCEYRVTARKERPGAPTRGWLGLASCH